MNYKVKPIPNFLKDLKQLAKRYPSIKRDLHTLGISLQANPHLGTDLGKGLRKIRMAITSKGWGKSGGARIITLNVILNENEGELLLITIYDKAERSTISVQEIDELLIKNGLK